MTDPIPMPPDRAPLSNKATKNAPAGPPPIVEAITAFAVLRIFVRIGVLAFGGSTQAWMHREIIEYRQWLSEKEFLSGFTVAQVLPGSNPVNMALYLGLKLAGGLGATAAVVGMVLPAFVVILILGVLYRALGDYPITHAVLTGVAFVGIGATLSVGIKVALRLDRDMMTLLIALATFAAVGVFRISMVPVVCVAVPLSVIVAYVERRHREKKRNG